MDADGAVKLPLTVAPLRDAENVVGCCVGVVGTALAPFDIQHDGVGLMVISFPLPSNVPVPDIEPPMVTALQTAALVALIVAPVLDE
jgi:hypothetical protein